VGWNRIGMVVLWVLALVVPGGLAALTLYLSYKAARAKLSADMLPDVVRRSFVPPAPT
jgi:hypothetical protein